MKTMLITGGSRGIGLACTNEFAHEYNVISTSRAIYNEFCGDLNDSAVRERLLTSITPDVFISSAKLNYEATADLLVGFYKKMPSGHIIHIGSTAGNIQSFGFSYPMLNYAAEKHATQYLANLLTDCARSNVKVTSLEPGHVMTDFGNVRERYKTKPPHDVMTIYNITPMDPIYLAKTIRWILAQPDEIVIKRLEIANQKSL